MYQMMLNRKHNRKGFTLVEVIVVLVILAILAAIMIPSMVKWIDEANDKAVLVEARTALLAAQTIASEIYGGVQGKTLDEDSILDLAGLTSVQGATVTFTNTSGTISAFSYTATKFKKTAKWSGTAWMVS